MAFERAAARDQIVVEVKTFKRRQEKCRKLRYFIVGEV
jgi:hypothetical protein